MNEHDARTFITRQGYSVLAMRLPLVCIECPKTGRREIGEVTNERDLNDMLNRMEANRS